MSQENAEVARRALEAAMRKPKPDFATVNALYHPEHVMVDRLYDSLEGEHEWVGAKGFEEHSAIRKDTWSDFAIEIHDARPIDDERVLIIASLSGRGAGNRRAVRGRAWPPGDGARWARGADRGPLLARGSPPSRRAARVALRTKSGTRLTGCLS